MYSGDNTYEVPPSGQTPLYSPSSPSHLTQRRGNPASSYTATPDVSTSYYGSTLGDNGSATTNVTGYTSSYVGGYYTSGTAGSAAPLPHASPYRTGANDGTGQSASPATTTANTAATQNTLTGNYAHNGIILCLWIPCWLIILGGLPSAVPLRTFAVLGLVAYGLDLANFREGVLYTVWFSTLVQSLVTMWFRLLAEGDDDDDILAVLLGSALQSLFFVATSCWITLQFRWLVSDSSNSDSSCVSVHLETALHSIMPLLFAAIATEAFSRWLLELFGLDTAATAAPHIYSLALAVGMMSVGAMNSSFIEAAYAIPERVAKGHCKMLVFLPAFVHVATFLSRFGGRFPATDDIYDLMLAMTVPFLLQGMIETLHIARVRTSIYGAILSTTSRPLSRQVVSLAAAFLASFAAQQRHLIPLCHRLSYHFLGVQSPTWLLTLYWTMATVSLLASSWIWGRISPTTGQPMFGEYHEDIVQLVLALSGLSLGKAFGLPWNMTPLPVLGTLGLSLWVSTRMLRYLAIFLFVLHATGVVLFTYRFVGIEQGLSLPIPGVELSLMRFGILVTVSSIMVGLVTGFSVRSNGGFMAPAMRRMDIAGIVLILYSAILLVLEITLLKRLVPTKELSGVEAEEETVDEALYDPALAYFTATILIGIVLFMRNVRILHDRSSSVAISLALGKAIAVFVDAVNSEGAVNHADTRGTDVLYRALVAALLCAVMIAPRVFLAPVHLKNSARNRRSLNGGPDLPTGASRFIGVYAFIFLPVALVATVPYVLFPFVNALTSKFAHASYYGVSTPTTEYIGPIVSLWGIAMLAMLNRFLPDGGGDAWKKLSALAFIMGIGIFFTAPTIGMSVGAAASSPYATMSSLGSQLIMRGKSRTGGWGILAAALATLLALSGPLELKERKHASGRKDKFLLFRTMSFSLLFGGGVAWFVTVQNMSESDWLFLVLTLLASMALAFFGTVAAVLGYFVEQDNFDEVEQIAKAWLLGLMAFFPIAGIPQLLRSGGAAHPFGTGGWLSTYLAVASLSAFSFALSLRFRQGKDSRTRGLGNMGCVIAWLSAVVVLYGRYGVAGLDSNYDVSTIAGIPASVFGTFVLAPMLLALEGETSARARGNRVVIASQRLAGFTRLNLPQLTSHNRWFPLFLATVSVLLVASLYAILLRGSGLFSLFGVSAVRTHADLFSGILGSSATETNELAALAEKAISQSMILTTSARLSGSGFWTSTSLVGPSLHLSGVFAMLPSLYLLLSYYWWGSAVVSNQVVAGLPLNAIPILLCRGIPCLTAAALLSVAVATMQLLTRRQSEQASRMRI
jgi:hypothetical protein